MNTMPQSDKPIKLLTEGDYTTWLNSVEAFHGIKINGSKLLFRDCNSENTITVHIYGSWDNLFAWKRCLGQEFTIRIKHKEYHGTIYLDARVRP